MRHSPQNDYITPNKPPFFAFARIVSTTHRNKERKTKPVTLQRSMMTLHNLAILGSADDILFSHSLSNDMV